MTTHTLTPWTRHGNAIRTETGLPIAWTHVEDAGDPSTRTETDANAAFIVTACNAHEALKAALQNTISALEEAHDTHIFDTDDNHPGDCGYCQVMKQANAALALADGKERTP